MLFLNSNITFDKIIKLVPLVRLIKEVFSNNEIETIERPASFILRLKNEQDDKIQRIIILPPFGFTSNQSDETNPHPEARKAKITIKGAIREQKQSFSLLKNIVKFQYYLTRSVFNNTDGLNAKIKQSGYKEESKSSKEIFYVVKETGFGFYHSLVNISPEWVVLVVDKIIRFEKLPDINSKVCRLDNIYAKLLFNLYNKICLYGDSIFEKEKKLVVEVCNADYEKVLPTLIEMLNVMETGKHEACTIFALILKKGKNNKEVLGILESAIKNNYAPRYFLENLIKKLAA